MKKASFVLFMSQMEARLERLMTMLVKSRFPDLIVLQKTVIVYVFLLLEMYHYRVIKIALKGGKEALLRSN
jgi:hypothetical protein